MKKHCNLWRNWDDIQDSYESLNHVTDYFAVNQSRIQPHAGNNNHLGSSFVINDFTNHNIVYEIHNMIVYIF